MSAQQAAALARDGRAIGTEVPVIAFEDVSLAFDENVVLRAVSFVVRAGPMTILLGASGSGKSVVLKVDPRPLET